MHTMVDIQLTRTTHHTVTSCNLPLNEEVRYKIYDTRGKLLLSRSIILINAATRLTEDLDISLLPAGNYTLEISAGDQPVKRLNITI